MFSKHIRKCHTAADMLLLFFIYLSDMSCKHLSNHQSTQSAKWDIVRRTPHTPAILPNLLNMSGPGANERHRIAGDGGGNRQGGGSGIDANGP